MQRHRRRYQHASRGFILLAAAAASPQPRHGARSRGGLAVAIRALAAASSARSYAQHRQPAAASRQQHTYAPHDAMQPAILPGGSIAHRGDDVMRQHLRSFLCARASLASLHRRALNRALAPFAPRALPSFLIISSRPRSSRWQHIIPAAASPSAAAES